MCTILKKLVGPGANFRIVGFVGKDAYTLTAGFYKIKLYKEFYINKLQLEVKVTISCIQIQIAFFQKRLWDTQRISAKLIFEFDSVLVSLLDIHIFVFFVNAE